MGVDGGQAGPGAQTPASGQKRKRNTGASTSNLSSPSIPGASTSGSPSANPNKKAKKHNIGTYPPEKRLRRFRPSPPQSFYAVYERATTQRFYVLSRTRCGTDECPEEMLELAGSTGNVYIIVIAREPSCDCPHARAGNQCKHLVYVLSRVLRAPFEYTYQLAFLASELRDIFANAPVPPADDRAAEEQGKRKAVEGDCPICFGEMHPGDREAVVWCRAACGQNIHKECFEMWASTKRGHGGGGGDAAAANVTCPFCRSVWKGDEDMVKKIKTTGKVNAEGYVSVADQLGMSTERDTSTYSQWWSGHDKGRRGYRSYYYEDEDEW